MKKFFPARGLLLSWLTLAGAGPALAQLTVTGRAPVRNALTAPRAANVVLTFSQGVAPPTAAHVKVFDGRTGQLKAGAYSTVGNVVTFNPTVDFHAGAEVSVSVPATILSATTGQPATRQVYQFRVSATGGAGTLAYASKAALPAATPAPNPADVQLADLDGDGDLDGAVASPATGTVEVLLNDGAAHLLPSAPRRRDGLPGCDRLRLADLDNDGDPDLIAGASSAAAVTVCLNDGTGRFGPPVAVGGTWGRPTDLGAADLNADGFLDLYVTDATNSRLRVLRNDGTGAFPAGGISDVSCPGSPTGVACTDFNSDGIPDFAVACRDNGQVAILLWQISQWTQSATISTGAGSNPTEVAGGDFNGDGKSDIARVCAGNDGTNGAAVVPSQIQIFVQGTTGAFSFRQSLRVGLLTSDLELADVNGDGALDLLCADGEGSSVTVCLNSCCTATGTFSDGSTAARRANGLVFTAGELSRRLASGDLDGDGDIDVLTANAGSADASVLENTPLATIGTLSPPSMGFAPRPLNAITLTAVGGPLNVATFGGVVLRDNHGEAHRPGADFPLSSGADGGVALLLPAVQAAREAARRMTVAPGARLTNGAALRPFSWSFDTRPDPSNGLPAPDGSTLALPSGAVCTMADWDGDGTNDLIVALPTAGGWELQVAAKLRTTGWGPLTTVRTSRQAFTPSLIRCADMDGDGLPETALVGTLTSGGGGTSAGLYIKIEGVPGESDALPLPEPATSLDLVDVDHDGKLEILIAMSHSVVINRFGANGSSTRIFPIPGPATGLTIGLGNPTSRSPDDPIFWLHTISGIAGAAPRIVRTPLDITGVPHVDEATTLTSLTGNVGRTVVADLDNDGIPEAITPMTSLHAINTKGTGATNGRTFPTGAGSGPTQVCVGDIDGDDDRDLVVVCPGNSTLWIGLNDGRGDFAASRTVTVDAVPLEAWLNDCDDDGRTDVVVRCADGSVRFFEVGALSPLDLIISTPTVLVPGTYRDITVLEGGEAIFAPGTCVSTTGTFRVRRGGTVKGGTCIPNPLGSRFILEDGGILEIPQSQGLSADGSFGPITGAGAMELSASAVYLYTATGAQETGAGLPTVIGDLLLGSDVTQLTLTNPVAVEGAHGTGAGGGKVSMQDIHFVSEAGKVSMSDMNCCGSGSPKKRIVSNGKLTLGSSAEGTAVFDVSRIETVGDVTVRQYVPAVPTNLGYHHFSPPVGLTVKFEDLIVTSATGAPVYTPVVNPAYNVAANPSAVRPYPTVFGFDETRRPGLTDFSSGYYSPDALTAPCPSGKGWSMYVPSNITWSMTGTVPGDVVISGLTRTGNTAKSGWHELGNPFPNVLNWDRMTIPAGMSGAVFVWESAGGANGRYLTRANGLGNLEDGLIGVGQGFFCQVIDPAAAPVTLTIPTDATEKPRNKTGHVTLMKREVPRPRLTLTLSGGASTTDETTLYFQTGATPGLDAAYDAVKPGRNVGMPTLATLSPDGLTELAINGLADTDLPAGATVELLLDVPAARGYTLLVGAQRFLQEGTVVLLDRQTNTRYDLSQHPAVPFVAARAGEIRGRFAVEFNGGRVLGMSSAGAIRANLSLYPNPAHDAVRVSGGAAGEPVQLLDGLGRVVRTVPADTATSTLPLAGLPPGVYVVRSGAHTQRLVVE